LKEIYKKVAVEEFHYFFLLEKGRIIERKKKKCRAIIDYTHANTGIIFVQES